MTHELNHVTRAILVSFLIIALTTIFWTVFRADDLLARDDNGRNVIAEQRVRRGTIFDRDDVRLAYSTETATGVMQRVYPYPEAVGAVGYYSLVYGTGGIESVFDRELRGDTWRSAWQGFLDDMLHRAPHGGDVRATLDLGVQRAATIALADREGAVVVVEIPSGRVLGMVSQPGYDPNTLDSTWEVLTKEKTSPLLNRVTSGLYQPGGAFQTVILAALLASYPDLEAVGDTILNNPVPGASEPVQVEDLTLACLAGVPEGPLTLIQAYSFGCPAPFVAVFDNSLIQDILWERLASMGLLEAPILAGIKTGTGDRPDALNATTPTLTRIALLAGQGDLLLTPLQMLQLITAIANEGNTVPLHLVDAVRAPGSNDWQPVTTTVLQPALLRTDVAAALRVVMQQAAQQNPAALGAAQHSDRVLYGHSALSFSGPEQTPYAWFLGFIDRPIGEETAALAVVVIIEDESNPGAAAQVAGAVFAAAD